MTTTFNDTRRESIQLWIAISILLVLAAYRLTAEMLGELESFFATYTELPIAVYLLNALFFWLLGLLWIAYRRWREALTAQGELEHVLMSISPDALVVVNRDREITMCSGQVEAMFGIKPKNLIGKKTDELYFDRRLKGEKGEIARRLEQFGFHVGYATGKRLDGQTFPLEVITGMIRYQQGAVVLMRDITERCNIEDALRHSEERFDLFMRYLPGFAFIKDSQNRHVYLNDTYERELGWNIPASLGKTDAELHGPELARKFAKTDAKVLAENRVMRYTSHIKEKHGERAVMTVKFPIPLSDKHDKLIGGLSLDISEQEAAERERIQMEHQMQQSQKLESLGLLAGGIAHDFNNLLMGILGHADLALNQTTIPVAVRRHIKEVMASAQRATDLANQLLAYSGKAKFNLQVLDISDVVEELSGLLRLSIAKTATLRVDLDSSLVPVECDPTQIRQVLMNIIVNASDALVDGTGTITVETGTIMLNANAIDDMLSIGSVIHDGHYAFVRISDTGIGMNPETIAHIFDPFFSTKRSGHGLGLAAASGIIRSQNGAIAIDSELGKGSVFTVYLPISNKPITPIPEQQVVPNDWKGRGTVLLADDEETVRHVARIMLESLGFEVLTAEDGNEAVELAKQENNNLVAILLDLSMPEIGGVDAFRLIREFNPSVPVIISSGYNKENDISALTDHHKPLFLKKPYRFNVIRERLHQAVSQNE